MNKKIIILICVIILLALAWYLISPLFIVKEGNDRAPITGETLLEGTLMPSAHDVMGKVVVIEDNGRRTLRFEDFDTVNGPDLYIYLATDTSAADFVDLGRIKATRGNVNYEIPQDVDLDNYDTVLVWCKQFSVLFSYADLQ